MASDAVHDLNSLVSSEERDFLIRNNGDEVKISSIIGKNVGLYFSASWCIPCCIFTPKLTKVYEELASNGEFEVIFISSDTDEESFNDYFSKMPWLSIPFIDSETIKSLKEVFKVKGIPRLVVLDANGKVSTEEGVRQVIDYGVEAFPFTSEQIKFLKEKEFSSLLGSTSRDYVVSNDGNQVKISSLFGKNVGLYFSASWCLPCRLFTPKLTKLYEELASNGEFEVIFVSSDRDEESFKDYFSKMPWLSIPFGDSETIKSLKEFFKVKGIPHLVVLDANGNNVSTEEGVRLVNGYGVEAFPFTSQQIKLLKDKDQEAKKNQTITSLLVSNSRDYVVSNHGCQIPISELEGKLIGLYFSLHEHGHCEEFKPTLIEAYNKLKEKEQNFEIVLISLDEEEEEDFNEAFKAMPWLALPFKDEKCQKLKQYFEVSDIPVLVIIGQDGKTSNPNAVELIKEHGTDAYPFTPKKLESKTMKSPSVCGVRDFVTEKKDAKVKVSTCCFRASKKDDDMKAEKEKEG